MPCYKPYLGFQAPSGKVYFSPDKKQSWKMIPIPCGKCVGCRLEYSRQWAIRCVKEAKYHDSNCFLTITYSDEFLPKRGLNKKHIQDFLKRLRRRLEYHNLIDNEVGLRYFLCGEYGGQTYRAHYHAIIFGYKPVDLVDFGFDNDTKQRVYISPWLSSIWGKGNVIVGTNVTFETCAYVARYVMKKLENKEKNDVFYKTFSKDFILSSRNPAIGLGFFKENQRELERLDKVLIRDGVECLPPRYFSRKLKEVNPDKYEEIKQKRIDSAPKETLERCMRRLRASRMLKEKQISNLKRNKI